MKKFTLCLAIFATSSLMKAQGLEGVIVEQYYQTNAADATFALDNSSSTTLTPGSIVYRVYLDMAPGYKFVQIFGNSDAQLNVLHPLIVKTTTNFYNDPNNGQAIGAQANSLNNTRQGTTLIDSYLTTGGVCAGKAGVLKIEDTDGSIGCSTPGVLINNPGGVFGAPINSVVANAQDGLAPSTTLTAIAPTALGIGSAADVFDQTAGGTFSCVSCAVSALGGVVGTTTTNAVLIGQFTTDGILSFSLNVQVTPTANPTQSEVYVPNNAQPNETVFPALMYTSPAPTVSTVGIEEENKNFSFPQFSIFPNPSNGMYNIFISDVKETSNSSFTIQDIAGRIVYSKNLVKFSGNYHETIDLTTLKNGMYFINVTSNGLVSTKKIVKD